MSTVLFLLLLGSTIIRLLEASSCCHDGWIMYKDSCYLFADEQKLDWNKAVMSAEREVSNTIDWYSQRSVNSDPPCCVDYIKRNITAFWTGASDADIEGIWKWIATDSELLYTAWNADGCQSKQNTAVDNHEDCFALNGAYNFCWSDGVCSRKVGFPLCEKNVSKGNSSGMMIIG